MSLARFRVALPTPLDGASGATVVVYRDRDLVSVRPLRRKRTYELPLSWVAAAVVWKVSRFESIEKAKAKRRTRRRR